MIKKFGYYMIPQMFENRTHRWQTNTDVSDIVSDLEDVMRKHNIQIHPTSAEFVEEEDLIDLMVINGEKFKDTYGSFYVTWHKEDDWSCTGVWYAGRTDDDFDEVHESWENI